MQLTCAMLVYLVGFAILISVTRRLAIIATITVGGIAS